MPATVARTRRTEIIRAAAGIRRAGQQGGHATERIVTSLRASLPELTALEAWRLALGWHRREAVAAVADLYRADGLRPPGLSEAMLCRWEHDPREKPGPEYTAVIARAYGATVRQLGLSARCGACELACAPGPEGYGANRPAPPDSGVLPMTTASGLPAVRETLALAAADAPRGSAALVEVADAAVEHYQLGYSTHPPHVLFDEVRGARAVLSGPLGDPADPATGRDLRRSAGWLSALLGNLAHHLGDATGARAHLAHAAATGHSLDEQRLAAWAHGALAMVSNSGGDHTHALAHAERGSALAQGPLQRAQLLAWAQLPALAALGRESDADLVLAEADDALDSATEQPGRFGYDRAEHLVHLAEAHLLLSRPRRAADAADESLTTKQDGTPGWVAASLLRSLADASRDPGQAAARALTSLDHVPANRIRANSRARLHRLDAALADTDGTQVRDLREWVRTLPDLVDAHGRAAG